MSVEIWSLTTDPSEWFDFESAINVAMGYSLDGGNAALRVFDGGCKPLGSYDEPSDCSKACLQPANIWNGSDGYGSFTLQNCLVYPAISFLLRMNMLTDNSSTFVKNMGYSADPDPRLAGYQWPAIQPCIDSFCSSNSKTKGCKTQLDPADGPNAANYSLHDVNGESIGTFGFTFPTDICTGLNANVNPDLGGPGVFLSYLLQIGLAILAWLNLRFQDTWTRYLVWIVKTPFGSSREAWHKASEIQQKLHTNKYRDALRDSLREFQAAQVFFMISTEIAVLVVLRNASEYQANSWQTIWNDMGVLYDLALAGCVPVVFMMLVLFTAGDRSAYMTYITTACVFLSGATWISVWKSKGVDAFAATSQNIESFPDTCGGPFAPVEYCLSSFWWLKNSSGDAMGGLIFGFCWFVAAVLLLDYIRVFARPAPTERRRNCYEVLQTKILDHPYWDAYERIFAHRRSLKWVTKLRLHERSGVLAGLVRVVLLAMELVLVACICILLHDYLRIFTDGKTSDSFAFKWSDWSLGQVISVTLWVSVIVRFVWNALVGDREEEHDPDKKSRVQGMAIDTRYVRVSSDNFGALENQDKSPNATSVPVDDSDNESHPMTRIQHVFLRN